MRESRTDHTEYASRSDGPKKPLDDRRTLQVTVGRPEATCVPESRPCGACERCQRRAAARLCAEALSAHRRRHGRGGTTRLHDDAAELLCALGLAPEAVMDEERAARLERSKLFRALGALGPDIVKVRAEQRRSE